MITLDKVRSTDFTPYLQQIFRIRLEGYEPIELELDSVIEMGQEPGPGDKQAFSLHFLGPHSSHYLVQHMYRLEHEQMGVLDLFLVPLGPETGRMRYEAVFN